MGSLGGHPDALDKSSDVPADMQVIDYSKLVNDNTIDQEEEFESLDRTLKQYGFFYLSNHSIPQAIVDEAFEWVR